MNAKGKILIIDDNEDVLFALNLLLDPYVEKIKVTTQPTRIEHFMTTFQPDVILLDMNFRRDAISGQEGFDCLEQILKLDPQAIVLFMTAYADTDKAVRAIKAGAIDFIPKPWEKEKLLATLSSAIKLRDSRKEVRQLKEQVVALSAQDEEMPQMIGHSAPMREVFDTIRKLSDTDANILILGENGTGKDLVARSLRYFSPRRECPFITIDLGSIPESLFESELFGYEKGAFTDARKAKAGRMEVALAQLHHLINHGVHFGIGLGVDDFDALDVVAALGRVGLDNVNVADEDGGQEAALDQTVGGLQNAGVVALGKNDFSGVRFQRFDHCIEHGTFPPISGRMPVISPCADVALRGVPLHIAKRRYHLPLAYMDDVAQRFRAEVG